MGRSEFEFEEETLGEGGGLVAEEDCRDCGQS